MTHAEEAIRRILDGDEEAFASLVRQWERKVYNLAWRMLGNREEAQDVLQETFLSVFRFIRTLRDPKRFSTWLYRITLNHCRARWRAQDDVVSLDAPVRLPDGEEQSFGREFPAGSHGEAVEAADLVWRALAGLSEEHRTAIILKEYLGLSLEEAASVMGCPLSTAKSRLYHGLRGAQRNLQRLGLNPGRDYEGE